MKKVYINKANCFSPLGFGISDTWNAISKGDSGIRKIEKLGEIEDFYAGIFKENIIEETFAHLNLDSNTYTRLEKLALITLNPIVEKGLISSRTALVIATTKGNIQELEKGNLNGASISLLASKITTHFGFKNQPIIICNACVSGLMAVATAKRLIQMNQFENAFVLALDEITPFVVSGFSSFQAMSKEVCKPFDKSRTGINLGEAAAAVYVSKEIKNKDSFEILGEGSIADANHISGPSRTGEGLYLSIQSALREAGISSQNIDVVSAHGTATLYNDEMEAIAFDRSGLAEKPVHSLKAYFGHTLGAAGLLELIVLMESLKNNKTIISKGFEELGVSIPLNITTSSIEQDLKIGLKTASGFGGSNTALLIKKVLENEY